MKLALVLLTALLLTSCRTGDLITYYSEEETTQEATTEVTTVEITTSKPTTTAPTELPIGSLALLEMTETVAAGKKASVTVKGLPNTEYSITVTYSSVSEAKGLENKLSDENGAVSWSWRVGNKTKPGKYKIEIQCSTEKITLYFNVISTQT